MFGHQDDDQNTTSDHAEPQADATLGAGSSVPGSPAVNDSEVDEALKALTAGDDEAKAAPAPVPKPVDAPTSTARSVDDANRGSAPQVSDDDASALLAIKQSALEQLTPLIDQLDQTAEERFRTTMMMIQAADNQSLLQTAYDAAQQIEEEKVKAQALLDVVNEINYFTQQNEA